jgi:hypothetical protein
MPANPEMARSGPGMRASREKESIIILAEQSIGGRTERNFGWGTPNLRATYLMPSIQIVGRLSGFYIRTKETNYRPAGDLGVNGWASCPGVPKNNRSGNRLPIRN